MTLRRDLAALAIFSGALALLLSLLPEGPPLIREETLLPAIALAFALGCVFGFVFHGRAPQSPNNYGGTD